MSRSDRDPKRTLTAVPSGDSLEGAGDQGKTVVTLTILLSCQSSGCAGQLLASIREDARSHDGFLVTTADADRKIDS